MTPYCVAHKILKRAVRKELQGNQDRIQRGQCLISPALWFQASGKKAAQEDYGTCVEPVPVEHAIL